MKIVHVSEDMSHSSAGVSASVMQLAAAAVDHGVKVEIISPGDSIAPLREGISMTSLRCRFHPWRYAPDLPRAIASALRTNEKVVVHVHGVWMYPQWTALRMANSSGTAVVFTPHNMLGGWLWNRGSIRRLKKSLYYRVFIRDLVANTHVHALSRIEASSIAPEFAPLDRVTTIPNAIDTNSIDSSVLELLPEVRERYVLFLGRVHPVKGIDVLIRAVAMAGDQDFRLLIAGPYSEDDSYVQLLKRLAVRSPVPIEFVGPVRGRAKWNLLRRAWLLCAPSHSEGLSMSALEAMSYGTPVITSVGAGLPEAREGGGFVVQVDDQEIAASLRIAFQWSLEERIRRGEMARAVIDKQFSNAAVWPKYSALYERAAGLSARLPYSN